MKNTPPKPTPPCTYDFVRRQNAELHPLHQANGRLRVISRHPAWRLLRLSFRALRRCKRSWKFMFFVVVILKMQLLLLWRRPSTEKFTLTEEKNTRTSHCRLSQFTRRARVCCVRCCACDSHGHGRFFTRDFAPPAPRNRPQFRSHGVAAGRGTRRDTVTSGKQPAREANSGANIREHTMRRYAAVLSRWLGSCALRKVKTKMTAVCVCGAPRSRSRTQPALLTSQLPLRAAIRRS